MTHDLRGRYWLLSEKKNRVERRVLRGRCVCLLMISRCVLSAFITLFPEERKNIFWFLIYLIKTQVQNRIVWKLK